MHYCSIVTFYFKRIVQSKVYFWYLKEEQNLGILLKVAPNSHVLFLRYWQLKFPHFLPKWTWSKQMWCHGCTMAKVCFVILYISLCCFDLELVTVASLPAGDLKSMEYSSHNQPPPLQAPQLFVFLHIWLKSQSMQLPSKLKCCQLHIKQIN